MLRAGPRVNDPMGLNAFQGSGIALHKRADRINTLQSRMRLSWLQRVCALVALGALLAVTAGSGFAGDCRPASADSHEQHQDEEGGGGSCPHTGALHCAVAMSLPSTGHPTPLGDVVSDAGGVTSLLMPYTPSITAIFHPPRG